jgi:hypothetical protein
VLIDQLETIAVEQPGILHHRRIHHHLIMEDEEEAACLDAISE